MAIYFLNIYDSIEVNIEVVPESETNFFFLSLYWLTSLRLKTAINFLSIYDCIGVDLAVTPESYTKNSFQVCRGRPRGHLWIKNGENY